MGRLRFPERLPDESLAVRLARMGAQWGLVLTPPMATVRAYDPTFAGTTAVARTRVDSVTR